MKWILFGLFTLFVAITLSAIGINGFQSARKQYVLDKDRHNHLVAVNELVVKINESQTEEDLFALKNSLPEEEKENLAPYLNLKLAIFRFKEAERLLEMASLMHNALMLEEHEPNPPAYYEYDEWGNRVEPPKVEFHPLVKETLEKAIGIYKQSKKDLDKLEEIKGDGSYNFALNYLKGEVYYRNTQVASTPETVEQLFNQTVNYFKFALRHKPRDINTVINIELLIKNRGGMLANGARPDLRKQQMLRPGRGFSNGN